MTPLLQAHLRKGLGGDLDHRDRLKGYRVQQRLNASGQTTMNLNGIAALLPAFDQNALRKHWSEAGGVFGRLSMEV